MKLIDSLKTKIEAIGGSFIDDGYSLGLCAPSGYVWQANGLPAYTIQYANNVQSWLPQSMRGERPNLDMGLKVVRDEAEIATIRHELDDDTWGAAPGAPSILPFSA